MAEAGEVSLAVVPEAGAFGALLTSQITKQIPGVEGALSRAFSGILGNAVPLAFAAAGAAAVKMASDYEDALSKIEGLVGLTHEQTVQLGDEMLELAKVVPIAPTELAKAMFFIESAGLRGERAMDALTMSAKASAAGLGDLTAIADAVTSAMNSYATTGLTAGEATDIMVAAVREGKLPAEDLAGVLGQVLPVAAQMKVEFYEVAAAIAASTRQGLNAARAATGVRFLLTAFIKPSAQAVNALGDVGLSLEEVQKRLAEKGLLNTLQTLAKRFDLSTTAGKQMFATVVGGARGLSVANILIGQNAEAVQKLTDNIKNSVGSTEKAFEVEMKDLSNQIALVVSTIKSTFISIGNVILPIVTTIVHALGAVLSPVLSIVADHATEVLIAFTAWYGLKSIPALISLISGAITGLVGAMTTLQLKATLAIGNLKLWASGLKGLVASLGGLGALAGPAALAVGTVAAGFIAFKLATDAAHRAFEAGVKKDLSSLKRGLDPINKSISLAARGVFDAVSHIAEATKPAQFVARGTGQAFAAMKDDALKAAEALRRLDHPVREVSDAFKAGLITEEQYHGALIAVIGSEAVYAQDALKSVKATGSLTDSQIEYVRALTDSGAASRTVEVLQRNLDTAVLSGQISWQEYAQAVKQAGLEMNVAEEALQHQAIIAEAAAGGFGEIKKVMEGLHPAFDALGLDFDEFVQGAREAALKGSAEFEKFRAKTIAQVSQALEDMAADISDSINLTTNALQELASDSKATAADYLKAFGKAREETQKFGRDLLEIARHGGPELARQLISMGQDGARAAATIAGANDKMRDKIIESFNAGSSAADKLATKLTKSIAGSLNSIESILKKIAKMWGINVDVKDNATGPINEISSGLKQLTAHDWEIRVKATQVKGSPIPEDLIKILDTKLTALTEDPWEIKVKASAESGLGKTIAGAQKFLEKLGSTVEEVFGQEFPKAYQKDVQAFEKATQDKLKSFQKQMDAAEKAFDRLNEKIKSFKDGIRSGFAGADDLISGMISGIQQAADNMAKMQAGEEFTGAVVFDPANFLAAQVGQAQQFAHKLAELAANGLAPALLSQLASQGQEALPLIDALLGGGKDLIQQFNDANKTIEKFAQATANSLSDAEFGGAIKKAKRDLNDLSDRIQHFNNRIEHQINDFINSLQAKRLGNEVESLIQSLNRSLSQLGGKVPHAAHGAIVRKPTLILAGEAGPEQITPLGKGAGVGDVNVYLNVEGNAVYSRDLADEVRDVLLRDKRFKGRLGME